MSAVEVASEVLRFELSNGTPCSIRYMKAESHDYVLVGMDLVADYENLGAGD